MTAAFDRARADFASVAEALLNQRVPRRRLHVVGARGLSSSVFALEFLARAPDRLIVIITSSFERARALEEDLSSLAPKARVRHLSSGDAGPFEAVRTERRTTLARLGALFELGSNQVDILVLAAPSLLRRVLSRETVALGSRRLVCGTNVDIDTLAAGLSFSGYHRTPLVEDEGSFSVRGELLDVWPALLENPVRLEFEFDKLTTITPFNPETQVREASTLNVVDVPLAREALLTQETSARAREMLLALGDKIDHPTRKTRTLIEEVLSDHLLLNAAAYLPAFGPLEPIWQHFRRTPLFVLEDPEQVLGVLQSTKERALETRANQAEVPHFEYTDHYVEQQALEDTLKGHEAPVLCIHSTDVLGPDDGHLRGIEFAPDNALSVEATDNRELIQALDRSRKEARGESVLSPLLRALQDFNERGLRVVLAARNRTQADRLETLLSHRGVRLSPLSTLTPLLVPSQQTTVSSTPVRANHAELWVGRLSSGMVAECLNLALVTEEEIFGRRTHRRERKAVQSLKAALDDLRSLSPGDFVIHTEHGVGRYLGLEHKQVGETIVDFFVVEYHAADKLYVPVYRLNQIQKHSGAEGTPKLDRLGGHSFEKTKGKARKKARDMADQLLRLYAERHNVVRPPLGPPGDDYAAFAAEFPFEETPDQAQAITDVLRDLQRPQVMDRLVSGDVGFGKTEVALRAAYLMALDGRQTALLCPTTVLCEQHYHTFQKRLSHLGIEVRALSRFSSNKEQTKTLAGLKSGAVDIVIGTHRILSSDVHFQNLGLLVIDEEQRFGVVHKERMKDLRKSVDVLTLSATPIPRTLSLAIGGLRDMSVIATPPETRRAIRTFVASHDRALLQRGIEQELSRGGQIYYVQNRIEGIYERAHELSTLVPGLRVRVAHGQLSERELERTMIDFVDGKADILVATSIIESGLDIPQANTIFIERADMFGLAQLYQIRGRVGRSSERAYCYLLVPPPSELSQEANLRLEALTRHTELGAGFQIASLDMEIRGAGDLLGADQSGTVTSVGFELFSEMLAQAAAELSGQEVVREVDPELSVDVEALLPESYVEEIGLRLSLYKRLSNATDEADIDAIGQELEDRFGAPPPEVRALLQLMRLKVALRRLRALGMNATRATARLHLRADTPLTAEALVRFVAKNSRRYSLTPDGQIHRRARDEEEPASGLAHAERMLRELDELL